MASRNILYPDPFPYADYRRYTYAMGIAIGDLIWVAGHLADEYDPKIGRMVCRGDLADQTRLALEKVRLVLGSAGAGFGDIVHQVYYITPSAVEAYPETLELRRELYGHELPVTTTVVANTLLRNECLIEVEVVAVRGTSSRRSFPASRAPGQGITAPSAVAKGGVLFITAAAPEGVGKGDVAAQARAIYDTIDSVLQGAGAAPSDIVRTIDYIAPAGLADYRETAGVRKDFFGEEFPTSTGIIVEGLLGPEALLEVSAIAVTGEGERAAYNPGWPWYDQVTFRPGIGKGGVLCLSGLTGVDPISRTVASDDLAGQTRQVYQQAETILAEAGLSMKNVVKTVDYIVPRALPDYRDTVAVRREFFGDDFPVSTGVIINRLLRPEYLIEIDFTAAYD